MSIFNMRLYRDEEGNHPGTVSTQKNYNTTSPTMNPSSPSIKPASPTSYPEPYSVPPLTPNSLDKEEPPALAPPPRPFPAPQNNTVWHRILYPMGVTPKHRKYEHWVGRIGFGAKVIFCLLSQSISLSLPTPSRIHSSPPLSNSH
jgi:hypothetical protein